MTAVAACNVVVKLSGTSTAMTDEAMTEDGSTDVYQIDDTAKRCIDWTQAVTVSDNGGAVSAGSYTVDYLHGKVIFSVSPTDPVTITGNYLPLWAVTTARAINMEFKRAIHESTPFRAVADGCYMSRTAGRLSVSGTLRRFDFGELDYDTGGTSVTLADLLDNATTVVLEFVLASIGNVRAVIKIATDAIRFSNDDMQTGEASFVGVLVDPADLTSGEFTVTFDDDN